MGCMMASKGTFKPGLFNIGLNIEKKLSSHYLNITRKKLMYDLGIAPIYIKPAIRNLVAFILFHMDLGRKRARLMLEQLIVDYPDDLNSLADLIYVYKEMGREKDAGKYKMQLDSYKDNPLCQARSILGQANALTYDWADDHNKTPKAFLKESWRILSMGDNQTEQVIKATTLIVEAYKVLKTIPETAHEKKINEKEKAVERFEKGIEKLNELNCSKEEILTWEHKLAIAHGRMETWRNRNDDCTDNRIQNFLKSLEGHSHVIDSLISVKNLEEPLKMYLAKSCIFFAQLYTTRRFSKPCIDHLSENLKKKIENLESLVDKAMELWPDGNTILIRYGRMKSSKKQFLEAIRSYNKSIELLPDKDINWFAYASRRDAYYDYSKELIAKKCYKGNIDEYLRLAYKDAEICLQSRCTQFCLLKMVEICFERARPNRHRDIKFYCQNKDFVYEALEILHETLKKRDINKDARIYALLGKYYPFISEYRKSLESIKMALELNKWSGKYPQSFSYLSMSFICFYDESKDRNLLSEFRYMLKEAKKRQCDKWVTDALKIINTNFPEMLSDLIENMIEWDARGCEDIVNEILQSGFSVRDDMRERFKMKLQEGNNQESDINGPAEIQVLETSESFEYDFFVLYSEKDKEWVNFMLRPQLEKYDDVINFRGCFPSRDFQPGERKLDSMSKAIDKSRKLLIILTPNNCQNKWIKLFSDVCILSMIKSKAKDKVVIPIIRESCEIPDSLQSNDPIDFTKKNDWDRLRMALTVNMDSTFELETKMSALRLRYFDPDEEEK